MITVRRSSDRLQTRAGWLESRHTFSWAEHCDPRYMGYRALRALNEDRIAPGTGFGMQTRREMEIVTAVAAGESNKGIARKLSLSEDTVKHHVSHVFDKLGVFSRLELAVFAINHKLVKDLDLAS